jgi:hypothetical protein
MPKGNLRPKVKLIKSLAGTPTTEELSDMSLRRGKKFPHDMKGYYQDERNYDIAMARRDQAVEQLEYGKSGNGMRLDDVAKPSYLQKRRKGAR